MKTIFRHVSERVNISGCSCCMEGWDMGLDDIVIRTVVTNRDGAGLGSLNFINVGPG